MWGTFYDGWTHFIGLKNPPFTVITKLGRAKTFFFFLNITPILFVLKKKVIYTKDGHFLGIPLDWSKVTVNTLKCYIRFLFQINAVLLNFLFKESGKKWKRKTWILEMDTWAANQHIRMISDTEDWIIDAENFTSQE